MTHSTAATAATAGTSEVTTAEAADFEARLGRALGQFRAGDLVSMAEACDAMARELTASPPGAADLMRARLSYWAARCARRRERPDDAMRLLYAGLAAAKSASAGKIECRLRAELVRALSALGQNEDALAEAEAALQHAAQLGDAVGQAAAQEALASIYWMTEDWALGLHSYRTASQQALACGDLELQVLTTLGLAATEEGVGQIDCAAGRVDEGRARLKRSVELQQESEALAARLGDRYLVMYSVLNRGCSLHSVGAFEDSRAVFEGCLADPRNSLVHGNALTMLGRIALDQGQPAAALGHLQRALPMLEAMNKLFPLITLLEALVDAHEALGDHAAALGFMRRYHAAYVKNASEKARLRAQALSVKYDTERVLAVAEAQRERADRLERSNLDLASQSAEHARASLEDALTGIANRRCFDEALAAQRLPGGEIAPCSIAMLDVDHFKQVNDEFSHQIGDKVLRRLAELLSTNCRRGDLAARYGGEEFVLLARTTSRGDMRQLCERVRQAVEQEDWSVLSPRLRVTVSLGVAHHDELAERGSAALESLVGLADKRLYDAKARGRNQVCDA